ncbi:hypothetical protein KFE25_001430 [Diacronema lutheri]|uniref:NADH dehydrogenase [ubiquinone] 1 beta subcomplex subunit 2, mitochondrial n=1 Tax=Diacronema lutheri TaxID=2081491 RepID=A0A8J6C4K9_DIALT|nr:hypothetical protein KFE25_001430 [Diacronema lutheri]
MLLGRLKTAALAGRALGRARAFAGGHGPTGYGDGPYRGIEPHLPSFWHTAVARGMGCVMWLWIFYRFKVDGKAFFGIEGHYDHVDKGELRTELLRWAKGLEYVDDEDKLEEVINAVASHHHHHDHHDAHGEGAEAHD